MQALLRTIRFEMAKVLTSKTGYITIAIVLILQPLFAMIEANSFLEIGLNATPETNPYLAEALPPLEYMGFDAVLFGLMPMVIFGGLIGASEFKNHSLRTTLLCQNNRDVVFVAKLASIALITLCISVVTNYLTIAGTHIALGEEGLDPYRLSVTTWKYIGYSVLFWFFLTMISFGIGLLFRNSLVPLFFLVPQVYNLGSYLAQRWNWGELLPVAAGDLMIASPTDALPHDPLKGGIVLLVWMGIMLAAARYSFVVRDVGGEF